MHIIGIPKKYAIENTPYKAVGFLLFSFVFKGGEEILFVGWENYM